MWFWIIWSIKCGQTDSFTLWQSQTLQEKLKECKPNENKNVTSNFVGSSKDSTKREI